MRNVIRDLKKMATCSDVSSVILAEISRGAPQPGPVTNVTLIVVKAPGLVRPSQFMSELKTSNSSFQWLLTHSSLPSFICLCLLILEAHTSETGKEKRGF